MATLIVKSGFKFRLYPTTSQETKLAVQFGCTRFVYNKMLAYRSKGYRQFGRSIGPQQGVTFLARLKKTTRYAWLKEADSQALQQAVIDLNHAFDRFFKGQSGYPKFKKKQSQQRYRYPQRFKLDGNRIYLPKVGWVRIVRHRALQGKMNSCTVSRTRTGNYFVSILCEHEVVPTPATGRIGVDVGLSHFATLSSGEKIANPRHWRQAQRRLRIRQRRLSRKQPGSSNWEKARQRVALVHEKVSNQRKDFHHQLSRRLVDQYGYIAVEDLHIKGLVRNHRLARAISDAGWAQFLQFCQYKQDRAGGTLVKVGRFFPSSKRCSGCGRIHDNLKLNDRVWTCPSCGRTHDRDENAAINIANEATVGHTESYACGEMIGVQPEAKSLVQPISPGSPPALAVGDVTQCP